MQVVNRHPACNFEVNEMGNKKFTWSALILNQLTLRGVATPESTRAQARTIIAGAL